MKTFIWDPRFVTGLETVDQQHHRLVDLINQLGEYMVTDRSETGLEEVFHQLTDYARYHFAEEEQLMRETGLDLRFVEPHVKRHHEFIAQVSAIWRSQGEAHHTSEVLNDFLVAWLAFHILREDQAMTRQIALVRTGESPAVAFEMETQLEDNNVAVLLQGLQNLYHVLSVQNRELAAANQTLEEKVQQRSAELQTANTLLQHERNELRALLVKVEASQNQLLQSEKMASVGLLAAGIAHEINNPVGFVNSNLGTLKDYVERLLGLLESTSIAWHPA